MRLVLAVIHFLFIGATGLTVHGAAVPNVNLNEERNYLQGWDNSASLTYYNSAMEYLDNFDDKWTNLADRVYYAMYTSAELSINNGSKDPELANRSSQSYSHYNKLVSLIKYAYHEWDANDLDDSTRLLLLFFGIVGIIGVRRTVKKSSSVQEISRRKGDVMGL